MTDTFIGSQQGSRVRLTLHKDASVTVRLMVRAPDDPHPYHRAHLSPEDDTTADALEARGIPRSLLDEAVFDPADDAAREDAIAPVVDAIMRAGKKYGSIMNPEHDRLVNAEPEVVAAREAMWRLDPVPLHDVIDSYVQAHRTPERVARYAAARLAEHDEWEAENQIEFARLTPEQKQARVARKASLTALRDATASPIKPKRA